MKLKTITPCVCLVCFSLFLAACSPAAPPTEDNTVLALPEISATLIQPTKPPAKPSITEPLQAPTSLPTGIPAEVIVLNNAIIFSLDYRESGAGQRGAERQQSGLPVGNAHPGVF